MLKIITALVAGALLGGCASITGTRNQPVSVRSSCGMAQVSGAACKLSNDKGEWHVNSTPGSVTVQKAFGDLAVECEKPGLGKGVRRAGLSPRFPIADLDGHQLRIVKA